VVRKKRTPKAQQLKLAPQLPAEPASEGASTAATARKLHDTSSVGLSPVAEEWLAKIRARLPDEGTAVVTVQQLPRRKFLVSFRASAFGETLISEAREESLDVGIREAGSRLFERLGATPIGNTQKNLGERVRKLFE
jgi:hypothetical protein